MDGNDLTIPDALVSKLLKKKVRVEYEVSVSDFEAANSILQALGLIANGETQNKLLNEGER